MTAYIVAYDLVEGAQESDYEKLIEALEKLKAVRTQKSTWLVAVPNTAAQLLNHLLKFMHREKDRLIVIEIKKDAGWAGHWNMKGTTAWMESHVGKSL